MPETRARRRPAPPPPCGGLHSAERHGQGDPDGDPGTSGTMIDT
ncbi:hypothetical protein DA2_1609 [Desulfovibrio sp. A2]|nr:hypothetical protein DA2_1609 [Desulfovibrio sp. A2]